MRRHRRARRRSAANRRGSRCPEARGWRPSPEVAKSCRITEGDARPLQISVLRHILTTAEDGDGLDPAFRPAHRRAGRTHDPSVSTHDVVQKVFDLWHHASGGDMHKNIQPKGWPRPKGLFERHSRRGQDAVRRRSGWLERTQEFESDDFVRQGGAGAEEHRRRAHRSRRASRAHRPHDPGMSRARRTLSIVSRRSARSTRPSSARSIRPCRSYRSRGWSRWARSSKSKPRWG